jgi:hypothetical protein
VQVKMAAADDARTAAVTALQEWPDSSKTAGIAEAMIAHAKLDTTPEELGAMAEREGLTRLYYRPGPALPPAIQSRVPKLLGRPGGQVPTVRAPPGVHLA